MNLLPCARGSHICVPSQRLHPQPRTLLIERQWLSSHVQEHRAEELYREDGLPRRDKACTLLADDRFSDRLIGLTTEVRMIGQRPVAYRRPARLR